jgi:Protein of unknown function (DUF5818)
MAKRLLMCSVALLFVAGLTLAGQESSKWTGVITNDMCGAKDASMAKAQCTKDCVSKHGAKLALYDAATKKLYVLDPQDKATGHEGHTVTVEGKLDGDTIHVTSLSMASK